MIDSKIEWTDDTLNFWWGCQKVSDACKFCYAERVALHFKPEVVLWGGDGSTRLLRLDAAFRDLARIENKAKHQGRPRRVFVQSMADICEERADLYDAQRQAWDVLDKYGRAGWVIPMLLTKRTEVMALRAREWGWPAAAWALTTVENQKAHDERVPHLLEIDAPVRALSCEPFLSDVRFTPPGVPWLNVRDHGKAIHWIIAGGESGPQARPTHPRWFRSLRDQALQGGAAFHFKQWGEWAPEDRPEKLEQAQLLDLPTEGMVRRVGKKAAGRLLDGREWNEIPIPQNRAA